MPNIASFVVTVGAGATDTLLVDYTTVDLSAKKYVDYVVASGTLTFPVGTLSQTVEVDLIAQTNVLLLKQFELILSNARTVATDKIEGTYQISQASNICKISGPPTYPAVPFPGRRLAILGDSIMYANNHWNPPTGSPSRNIYYSTGMTGELAYANTILNNAFELEPALQPNTNPWLNATSPNNGYNFAIYSSKISQWNLAAFDPLVPTITVSQFLAARQSHPETTLTGITGTGADNIGPTFNALNFINSFDMVTLLGGTNDLAGGDVPVNIVYNIMNTAITFAQLGKWVFVQTITPRSSHMLQAMPGSNGYTQAQIQIIMQYILDINDQLRGWLTPTFDAGGQPLYTPPPNIFLVDHWSALVGPTPTILAGGTGVYANTPTDPAGWLSPTSGIVEMSNQPAPVNGNYRTDSPGCVFNYDGLHFAPPGAYMAGKVMAAAMLAAGVPVPAAGQLGGSTAAAVAPMVIGPNLMKNPTMVCSPSAVRKVDITFTAALSSALSGVLASPWTGDTGYAFIAFNLVTPIVNPVVLSPATQLAMFTKNSTAVTWSAAVTATTAATAILPYKLGRATGLGAPSTVSGYDPVASLLAVNLVTVVTSTTGTIPVAWCGATGTYTINFSSGSQLGTSTNGSQNAGSQLGTYTNGSQNVSWSIAVSLTDNNNNANTGKGPDYYGNQGAGYTYGVVPDYWFIYRASNTDGESYSNFNQYTFSALQGDSGGVAASGYFADAGWPDGCLTTAIVNSTFTVGGISYSNVPGLAMTFNCPAGTSGGNTNPYNSAFTARYIITESQNCVANSYGFENPNPPYYLAPPLIASMPGPAPVYTPGQAIALDCILQFSGFESPIAGAPNLTKLRTCRLTANFLSVDLTNEATDAAVVSSIAFAESYYPFTNLVNCAQHPEDRYMAIRTPAVIVPTPASTETVVYLQINWQFLFDTTVYPASGTITIYEPRVATLTTASGAVPVL